MISGKEKLWALLAYISGVFGLAFMPLNILLPNLIAKKYKIESDFIFEHALDAANLNFSFFIQLIVLLLLASFTGMFLHSNNIDIGNTIFLILIYHFIIYYCLQVVLGIFNALLENSSNIKSWPNFFERDD